MPILYESYSRRALQEPERLGWKRTMMLAVGSLMGTVLTAGAIHLYKKGDPTKGPRGTTRTFLLASGSFLGVIGTAGIIHLVRKQ